MSKFILILIIVAFVFVLFPQPVEAVNIWRGAYCGSDIPITSGGPEGPCDFCDGLIVISNIITLLTQFAFAIAGLMVVVGALQLMTSGASPSRLEKGKKTIKLAIFGLVVLLVAWVFVNTIITVLASGYSSWYRIDITCPAGFKFPTLN